MAVLPKPATEQFCDFVLASQWLKRLTPGRKTLIQDVRTAAINQTTVTDDDWSDFLLSTFDWYQTWLLNSDFKT